ncbi:MAG: PP2C family protein-serine/threonine phosphatase [Jatrophihabitans sp.]|uniref:PP2C family protein-serine/threonine phosphatase n=1 Tax=Jatrophihabitans sp. TaxID=1932789 RepID=UPI003F7D36AF
MADALAGSLNLRRTLACVVHLVVPDLGSWASIVVSDGTMLRRMDTGGADDFARGAQARTVRSLDPDVVAVLQRAGAQAQVLEAPLPEAVRAAWQVPAVPDAGALVTAPLSTAAIGRAALAVWTPAATAHETAVLLEDLARRASIAITAAGVYEERATLASTLRASLQPAALPALPGVELGASYRAAQETTQIGGDFYDVWPQADGSWTLAIGDVCGKGVEAAVLTGKVRQSLRIAARMIDDPAATLRLLNDTLLAEGGTKFVTAVYGVVRPGEHGLRARIAVAGHPPPLLLHDGHVTTLPCEGTLIGMLPEVNLVPYELDLTPGDTLVCYTDGATEARGEGGLLGVEPLEELLADCAGLTAQAVTERLMQRVLEHLGGRPHDDIAIVAVRCAS